MCAHIHIQLLRKKEKGRKRDAQSHRFHSLLQPEVSIEARHEQQTEMTD